MARAGSAPFDHYRRKRVVSEHVIERVRERSARDFISMSDDALGNLIDSAVDEALDDSARVEEVLDDGLPTRVVDVSHVLDLDLRCVVRASSFGSGGEVVITALTPEQADAKRAGGKWRRLDAKPIGLGSMRVALAGAGVTLAAPLPPSTPSATIAPVALEPEPARSVSPISPEALAGLRALQARLCEAADQVSAALAVAETQICDAGASVECWLELGAYEVGWARLGRDWRICYRESGEAKSIMSAPRETRIAALEGVAALVEAVAEKYKRLIERVQRACVGER